MVGTLLLALAGCTSDAEWANGTEPTQSNLPELSPILDDATVEAVGRHVGTELGVESIEWPPVTVRRMSKLSRILAVETPETPEEPAEAGAVPLIGNPTFRDVVSLPGPDYTSVHDARGYYASDEHEIVINYRSTWTPSETADVLAHELAHAMDARPTGDGDVVTGDENAAEWARREGLASLVAFRWSEPELTALPPYGPITLEGATVRQAQMRLDHEQQRRGASSHPDEVGVRSLLPLVDLSVAMDWEPEKVAPFGREVLARDVLGIWGLLELLGSPYLSDQIAVTRWRGDSTEIYSLDDGTECMSSRIRFADESSAIDALFAFRLPGVTTHLFDDYIELHACEGGIRRDYVSADIDYEGLESVMRLATRVAEVVVYDDPEFAMCVARAEHLAPEYIGPKEWTRSETVDAIVRRTGDCR